MKAASDFRHSKSEAENRLVKVAKETPSVKALTDIYVCFNCGSWTKLNRGELGQLYLPPSCAHCKINYTGKFQFCVPDLVITLDMIRFGVVFVNENKVHGRTKVVDRDRKQIELLRENGYEVFVLWDSEIYEMTNSTLRIWIYGAAKSLKELTASRNLYSGEKEYPCLL